MKLGEPKTVDYVNISRYSGRWYEQASIPAGFEANCTDTQAHYSPIDSMTIEVENSCVLNGQGQRYAMVGKGLCEDNTHSKLKLIFNPIEKVVGQYWIVKLGEASNYGYSVVSSSDYVRLYILSREAAIDQATYDSIIEWLKIQGGFRYEKLVRTKR